MTRERRKYVTDDVDQEPNPMAMHLDQGPNGDWYLSIMPEGDRFTRHCVRITTSGNRCPDMPQAVHGLYQAMVRRDDPAWCGREVDKAEARAEAAEVALASLRAAAQRVVALQPGAYSEPTPAELRRFSESVNDLEDAAAKVPASAPPVVTLSAEQAGLAIDALDVWLMNMQCVEETEAMIAVRQFLRDALEGMGESDG